MSVRVGHIIRHEDESGVSGTGVVAELCEFSDGEVVVHWLSHTPSTNHYRNIKQVEQIHGHGGKTEMVIIWEEPSSREEETDEEPPDAEVPPSAPKAEKDDGGRKSPSRRTETKKRSDS